MRETAQNCAQWWPKQAARGNWDRYNTKVAARDAILEQCDSGKLQKKITADNLKFKDILKHGLAYEQSELTKTAVTRMRIM